MKSPVVMTMLLVLAAPAAASPRHPTPAQWRDMHKFSAAASYCANHRTDEEGGEVGETKTKCDIADRLRNKLKAQGFCTYAKGGVGRPSTDGEHCYTIHDPSVPARFHQS